MSQDLIKRLEAANAILGAALHEIDGLFDGVISENNQPQNTLSMPSGAVIIGEVADVTHAAVAGIRSIARIAILKAKEANHEPR